MDTDGVVFLEPPIIVEQADMPWNQSLSEFDSTATTESEEQTPETTPRAWWLTAKERTVYRSMSPIDSMTRWEADSRV
jgi:hypothetical protein